MNQKNQTATAARPPKSHNRQRFEIRQLFRQAKTLERKGQWRQAVALLEEILQRDAQDSHSYLALAKLQARRRQVQQAHDTFRRGTTACPNSIHLWQAWAIHSEATTTSSTNNPQEAVDETRPLFERALALDPYNPYVCHAYGLYEKQRHGNVAAAQKLWETALQKHSTAALVCSLGQVLLSQNQLTAARDLYAQHLYELPSKREKVEVFLAYAWLEERYFHNGDHAHELLSTALRLDPTSSVAQVAMARLEGRRQTITTSSSSENTASRQVTLQRLAQACQTNSSTNSNSSVILPAQPQAQHRRRRSSSSPPQGHKDGRVYNAWANLEVKNRRYRKARQILREGLEHHPHDFSLWQAAGKVEELLGHYTEARTMYSESLSIQPSAPTLVAYALLELHHPPDPVPKKTTSNTSNRTTSISNKPQPNFTQVQGLFEEALLLDPRHGPAYNSYGNAEFKRGNVEAARQIFERGVHANCSDAASVYHGYGKLELSLGHVTKARALLQQGRTHVMTLQQHVGTDSPHRERSSFLFHTLGMLELNRDNAAEARQVFLNGLELLHGNTSSSSQLLLGVALAEVQLGNPDEARVYFEKSVQVNERHAQAWQAWGVMEMRQGNFATAQTLFQCGLKQVDSYNRKETGALWLAYATLEGRRGNVAESRALFTQGLQAAPHHTPLLQAWASLELRVGNVATARILITKALTRDKHNGSGWMVAAEIERRDGNLGLVKLILRRGIECCCGNGGGSSKKSLSGSSSDCVELYRSLGDALLGEGKIQEAREIYERGIEMDPQHAPLYHSLAELEAQVFNVEGLSKLNKRAAKVFKTSAFDRSSFADEALSKKFAASGTSWGSKHSASSSRTKVTRQVAALAQRIVEDDDYDEVEMEHKHNQNDWRHKGRGRRFGNSNKKQRSASFSPSDDVDPDAFLESMSANLIQEGMVGDLLNEKDGGNNQQD